MQAFIKVLGVGKDNRYSIDVSNFAAGQTIDAATASTDSLNATVGAVSIDGNIVSSLITGVTAGRAVIHFTYSTSTRDDCFSAQLLIAEC